MAKYWSIGLAIIGKYMDINEELQEMLPDADNNVDLESSRYQGESMISYKNKLANYEIKIEYFYQLHKAILFFVYLLSGSVSVIDKEGEKNDIIKVFQKMISIFKNLTKKRPIRQPDRSGIHLHILAQDTLPIPFPATNNS